MTGDKVGEWFHVNSENAPVIIHDHPIVLSGICSGDTNAPGWSLHLGTVNKNQPSGPRQFTRSIIFSQPFKYIPAVTISIQTFDVDVLSKTSARIGVEAMAITREGFTASFYTWFDTVVWGVRANWMAIGS